MAEFEEGKRLYHVNVGNHDPDDFGERNGLNFDFWKEGGLSADELSGPGNPVAIFSKGYFDQDFGDDEIGFCVTVDRELARQLRDQLTTILEGKQGESKGTSAVAAESSR